MQKTTVLLLAGITAIAASAKTTSYTLTSPDGKVSTEITAGKTITFTAAYDGNALLEPSTVGIVLENGKTVGTDTKVSSAKRKSYNGMIASPFYRSDSIADCYNQLTLGLGKDWDIQFRAYNDGIAYRFVSKSKKAFIINNEIAEFNFSDGAIGTVPFVNTTKTQSFETQFFNSFENQYTTAPLPRLDGKRLAFLPAVVEPAGGNRKVLLAESALLDYPGMFVNASGNTLKAVFANYPKTLQQGGHNNLQELVPERENFIAKISAPRALPWRIAVVAPDDRTLAATELAYLLGEPSRVDDTSWIKPGKVAWEWWNALNLYGVDFKTGVNNDTYKAYIDFAGKNGIEYVILDEGWAVNKKADLFQVVPEIDLPELVRYGKERNVGLILWAGYYAFNRDIERVCKHYSEMGIKGFKIDFMDRDDQLMSQFYDKAAATAAKYHLVIDFHGAYKPAGINRTYPNVLNVEGVFGLENMKWSDPSVDQVTYDCQIPFIRQAAGPMDYTQGAMRNASKGNYRPVNSEPMSQGTRCRQLALYMVLDSPLDMLCDSPSNYNNEKECLEFIAGVPTTWDETRIIDGKMGEYIITARRKGSTWYIGGITDWTPRDIEVDLSFLSAGRHAAEIFADGANADRSGRDFKLTTATVESGSKLKLHLAPGGGFAVRIK